MNEENKQNMATHFNSESFVIYRNHETIEQFKRCMVEKQYDYAYRLLQQYYCDIYPKLLEFKEKDGVAEILEKCKKLESHSGPIRQDFSEPGRVLVPKQIYWSRMLPKELMELFRAVHTGANLVGLHASTKEIPSPLALNTEFTDEDLKFDD